jgi:hypothetical protein
MVFMRIQEAYELLTGRRRRGLPDAPDGAAGAQQGDWAFHDWFWSFKAKRNWASQVEGRASPPPHAAPPAEEQAEVLRTQLAGLRHRAAIRRVRCAAAESAAECAAAWGANDADSVAGTSAEAAAHMPVGSSPPPSEPEGLPADGWTDEGVAAAPPPPPRPAFVATEERRTHVAGQLAGLHRRAAMKVR